MSSVTIGAVSKIFPAHGAGDEPVKALHAVSFNVADKEFCSILGHSGCGKTTLLMMLAGFEQPSGGKILVDGQPVGAPTWQRTVVFQDYALFPHLSVRQNIAFARRTGWLNPLPHVRDESVDRWIAAFHLESVAGHFPHQISGGQRQRTALARALVNEPTALLLDEPFAGVDPISVVDIQQIIKHLCNRNIGVLITDHNVRETLGICDHAYILNKGQVIAEGPPRAILEDQQVRNVYLGSEFRL